MATAQTIINSALTSLRQPTITGVPLSDSYQLLVLQLFNEVKQQVEDETQWRALDQTITVSLPASSGYGPAGGGYVVTLPGTNRRSRVRRVPVRGGGMSQSGYMPAISPADNLVALVFDTTTGGSGGAAPYALIEMPLDLLRYKLQTTNWQTGAQPQFFALSPGSGDNGGVGATTIDLYVYPPTNTPRTLQVTMVVPQSDFNASLLDSNGLSEVLTPQYPLLQGLKWKAYEERGEELGPSNAFSQEAFEEALADAVGKENGESGDNMDLVLL